MDGYQSEAERLRGLRASRGARTGEHCPDAEQLLRLAAGLLEAQESAALMDHAAGCDACGTLLKIAVEDLQSVEIPAEAAGAMSEAFQTRMVSELRRQSRQDSTPTPIWLRRRVWAPVGIAAGVVLLVLAGKGTGLFGPSPERLVARAYEVNRIWPIRFPGASYTPVKSVERSASVGGTPLAEADAVVSKGLDAHPKDPHWLQLRSEVDFLRRRYDAAIADLQPFAEGSYISIDVWVNLGIAHLARGMADSEPADSEKAVEYFSRALDADARNPIALFNRALALETIFLWDRAEQDWKTYLEVDSASGWAAEARDHLNQVTQKKKSGSAN
jgi:tetratricopeptide (TPR) repeat protein